MISLKDLIEENFQLAKKLYVDNGELTSEEVSFIKSLASESYLFKTLADLYIEDRKTVNRWSRNDWQKIVTQLKNYNKNIFPIKGFSYDSKEIVVTKRLLEEREDLINIFSKFPSLAKRNLSLDIKIPRASWQIHSLKHAIDHISIHLRLLDNRSDAAKNLIYKKIFNSSHPTFESVLDFLEDKVNLLNNKAYTKQELYTLISENSEDLRRVYDKGNIVIVDVTSQPGIKLIGSNSLWCFTYGDEDSLAGEQWDRYSYNSHVYAIINFSVSQETPEFIHIVTKPWYNGKIPYIDPKQKRLPFDSNDDSGEDTKYYDDTGIFNMANEAMYGNPYEVLNGLVNYDPSALKVFTFRDI
jgi:hypothetical protein